MASHAYGGNVRGREWVLVGGKGPRVLTQEVVICGNLVEIFCCEGTRLVASLKFDLYEWPDAPEAQRVFLEERYPLLKLRRAIGNTSITKAVLLRQVKVINEARGKFNFF